MPVCYADIRDHQPEEGVKVRSYKDSVLGQTPNTPTNKVPDDQDTTKIGVEKTQKDETNYDLGNDYFLVYLSHEEDQAKALTNGP